MTPHRMKRTSHGERRHLVNCFLPWCIIVAAVVCASMGIVRVEIHYKKQNVQSLSLDQFLLEADAWKAPTLGDNRNRTTDDHPKESKNDSSTTVSMGTDTAASGSFLGEKPLRLSNHHRPDRMYSPPADDWEMLKQIQIPQASSVLFEFHHDQYALSDGHTIKRLKSSQGNPRNSSMNCLHHVANELNASGLPYMLFFGTLLGAFRHHGFIPWDVDVDIVMLANDTAYVREMLLQRAKSHPVPHGEKYQWIVRAGKDSDIISIKVADLSNGYYVDVFVLKERPNGQFQTNLKLFARQALYPTQPCVFGEHVYQCPANPEAVLRRLYGNIGIHAKHKPLMQGLPVYHGIIPLLPKKGEETRRDRK